MDAVLKPHQAEQRVSPNKQNRIKIPKKNMRNKFMSNPCDNFATNVVLSNPLPPPPPPLHSSFFHQQIKQQQPPLLPLPTVSPIQPQSQSTKSRRNRTKEIMSQSKPITTRDELKKKANQSVTELVAPVVFSCTSSFRPTAMTGNMESFVFNLSPPPSSLPMPKFSVRR